jgi:hypothetical protein
VAWYERAARSGHAIAQYNLAVMLTKGQGCQIDLAQSRSWFEKSAAQGLGHAQTALSKLRAETSSDHGLTANDVKDDSQAPANGQKGKLDRKSDRRSNGTETAAVPLPADNAENRFVQRTLKVASLVSSGQALGRDSDRNQCSEPQEHPKEAPVVSELAASEPRLELEKSPNIALSLSLRQTPSKRGADRGREDLPPARRQTEWKSFASSIPRTIKSVLGWAAQPVSKEGDPSSDTLEAKRPQSQQAEAASLAVHREFNQEDNANLQNAEPGIVDAASAVGSSESKSDRNDHCLAVDGAALAHNSRAPELERKIRSPFKSSENIRDARQSATDDQLSRLPAEVESLRQPSQALDLTDETDFDLADSRVSIPGGPVGPASCSDHLKSVRQAALNLELALREPKGSSVKGEVVDVANHEKAASSDVDADRNAEIEAVTRGSLTEFREHAVSASSSTLSAREELLNGDTVTQRRVRTKDDIRAELGLGAKSKGASRPAVIKPPIAILRDQ